MPSLTRLRPQGYTTYRLSLRAKEGADVGTIYTIFGDGDTQMVIPAAFQADAPFGADIGGVSPEFFPYSSAAAELEAASVWRMDDAWVTKEQLLQTPRADGQ